ncbi:hypothetical protein GE061_011658 [Apolygus lucorum]|uniref:Uncharacterized protein n=1 Tax=Apolygus lucorum TaxID=248454 RepID=A0A8S9XXZ9_APOLU|nr:hypothetical protein GE061_011658 [Apolygus lucorum]
MRELQIHFRTKIVNNILLKTVIFNSSCLLHPSLQKESPEGAILRNLVVKGWEEDKKFNDNEIKIPTALGITLSNPKVSNKGFMKVKSAPKHARSYYADNYALNATLNNYTTTFNYVLDSGESGLIKLDSDARIVEELVVKGWDEHQISDHQVQTQVSNVIYPGIVLEDALLANRGTMRVSSGLSHTETESSDENILKVTIDDLIIKYNYTLDNGESGHAMIKFMSRTYSIKLESIPENGHCRTKMVDLKLIKEGPMEITADGGDANSAVKVVERLRHLLLVQTRSFSYFEVMAGLEESLTKREPKLCKKKVKGNINSL